MQADLNECVAAVQAAPWPEESFEDLGLRDRASLLLLLLGLGLLWPFPLGGVLLMVAATFGLAVSWEDQLSEARPLVPAVPALGRIAPL